MASSKNQHNYWTNMRTSHWIVVAGTLLALALAIGCIIGLWQLRNETLSVKASDLERLSLVLREQTDRSFQSIDLVIAQVRLEIDHLAASGSIIDESTLHKVLKTNIIGLPQGQALVVFDADGKMIGHSREFPTPSVNVGDREYFVNQKDMDTDRLYVSQPLRNRVNGRWMVSLSRHYQVPGRGGFGGVVMAAIEVEYFSRLYRALNLPDGVSIVLQRLDGVTLVQHPWEDTTAPPRSVLGLITGTPLNTVPSVGGQPMLASIQTIPDLRLAIGLLQPETVALAPWRRLALGIGLGTAAAVGALLVFMALLNRQVTKLEQREAMLVEARSAAVAASLAKSSFLANMSHEIRTPMNAILGLAYLLEQTTLDADQQDYVHKTRISAQSLLRILNDILDLSKVEAGKLELVVEPFRLDNLMKMLATVAAANAKDKDIEVLFDIKQGTPLMLVGDSLHLQQVLTNLASNAIKFTERGEVVLSVEATATDEFGVDLLFSVKDTGIGIAPESRRAVFDAFSQADNTTSRRFGGTGLGLTICHRLVELSRGRIWCDSEEGQGSTFFVAIRFGISPDAVDEPMQPQAVPRNIKVLIADDKPTARQVLATMIAPFGWTVVVASSGQQALEEINRAFEEKPFDLLFLDWSMPDVGGHEIVQHLRDRKPPEIIPLILVVTAFESERVRRDSGDDPLIRAILTKPVTPSSLLDAVAAAQLSASPADTSTTPSRLASTVRTPLAGLSLLVVEDNTINQMVARRILESVGATVTVVADGFKALEVLLVGRDPFHCVLMDIQMPGMDGYETTRAIRTDLGMVDLPIIAMTANAMASDRERCLAVGMNDHIGKPFEVTQMTAMITKYVRHRRLKSPQNAGMPVIADHKSSAGNVSSAIDTKDAFKRVMGDHELLKSIMGEFTRTYADTGDVLARLLSEGKLAAVGKAAHDLKGVCANLGAKSLEKAAETLQKAAENCNVEQAKEACDEVRRCLPTVIAEATRIAEGQDR